MRLPTRIALLLCCGCGRFGFDAPGAASDSSVLDGSAAICHTGVWSTPTPIAPTVTGSEESDPSISLDERELFFTSNRSPSLARALWVTTRPTIADAFGTPTRIAELDDAADDSDPDISPDGTILFSSRRSSMPRVHVAKRADASSPFMDVGQLDIIGDTISTRGGPKMTDAGFALYYSRDLEVAVATRTDVNADFTFVRELDELNAPPTDGNPTVTADGLEMFFDTYRNGPPAIFWADRLDTGSSFSAPSELAELAMVPSTMGAGSPEISADGRTLYYWINVGGQLDLYTSTRSCM